ncbi:HD domain-containing protein [Thermodesulfobacteriota bacterium]
MMKQKDPEALKTWFSDYVAGFYTDIEANNRNIRLKEKHTERVCRNMVMLGKALGLPDQKIILAEIMGLFHDLGRFRQYATYGTFNDRISVNHARLGIRQMARHRVLSGYPRDEKRLIAKAIACHNTAEITADEDGETLFFIRLLRDADKLDIYKVFINYYQNRGKNPNPVVEIGLPDDPACSPKVVSALNQGRIALMEDLKTLNDFKLLLISWVFDLNFVPSFQIVQRRGYVERIEATLPDSEDVSAAVSQVRDYVKRHL